MTNNKTTRLDLTKYLEQPVRVFLVNGIKITGIVKEVYEDGLRVVSAQHPDQEVFRHAMSSISLLEYD